MRRLALILAVIAPSAMLPVVNNAASWADDSAIARAARTLDGSDTAHMHLVHQHEAVLYEEGSTTGALPGHVRAQLNVGPTLTGRVTIYTRVGSIRGNGSATLHGVGRYQSFGGSLTITSGTGRYRHIRGHGGLYGTFDRETYALVVQTTGSFFY